jgi:integrase
MQEPNDDPETILRWEDHIVPILEHPAIHIRDKALVAVGWEAHPRPVEVQQLSFSDVEDKGDHMTILLTGPQGIDRKLVIVGSAPYLRKWIQAEHPVVELLADDAEPLKDAAPGTLVWTGTERNHYLSSAEFLSITERARKRANVTAEVTLEKLRKSRAKQLAAKLALDNRILRERFGWIRHVRKEDIESLMDNSSDEDIKPRPPIQCSDCGAWRPRHQPCLWCGAGRS